MPRQGRRGFNLALSFITLSLSQILRRQLRMKKVKIQARLMLGEHLTENTWYLWVITIVLLDSFQIYVDNSFILKWFTEMVTQQLL